MELTKICEYCGKEFKTKNKQRKYCSTKCSDLSHRIDISGQKFGKLTVIRFDKKVKRNTKGFRYYWLCRCECGTSLSVTYDNLKRGHTKSCGCLKHDNKSNIKHGLIRENKRLYNIWKNIKQRCNNINNKDYQNYGARGIKVYNEWDNNFEAFYKWSIQNGYAENLSIDRINFNKGYVPSNCRWVDSELQANNTRRNKNITYNNETKTLSQWCKTLNINYNKTKNRLDRLNWSVDDAFTI